MYVHEIKDLAMIYSDCDDYKVRVWCPEQMRSGTLIFTGSSNTDKTLHFNISFDDGNPLAATDAFRETLEHIIESGFDMKNVDWNKVFLEELLKQIHKEDEEHD